MVKKDCFAVLSDFIVFPLRGDTIRITPPSKLIYLTKAPQKIFSEKRRRGHAILTERITMVHFSKHP